MDIETMVKLAELWKTGGDTKLPYNIANLTFEIQKLGFGVFEKYERMLLVGYRNAPMRLWEDTVGELIAVVPGIILCNFPEKHVARFCTGVLSRTNDWRYKVEVFGKHNGDSLYGGGNADITVGPGPVSHRNAAAVFYWGYGRDEGGSVGMTAARWEEMHPWIERWLNV